VGCGLWEEGLQNDSKVPCQALTTLALW